MSKGKDEIVVAVGLAVSVLALIILPDWIGTWEQLVEMIQYRMCGR